MAKVIITSFFGTSDLHDDSWSKRQRLLHSTAIDFGELDQEIKWSRKDLIDSEFYRNNKDVLDEPRGCGLWAWKPWVILQTLEQASNNDYVLYHDIGKPFRDGDKTRGGTYNCGNVIELPIHSIIEWAENHGGMFPGVNTPHYGPASKWTKRDCFIGMECDREEIWRLPLVQAGYNAWKKTPSVVEFLRLWLECCFDRRLISDDPNVLGQPNLPGFNEHRHDQSILTNLVRREGVKAYGSETDSTPYIRNFNYLVRRVGLDRVEHSGGRTLTRLVHEKSSSKNLPVSVTSWIDLDVSNKEISNLDVLCVHSGSNLEESLLQKFFKSSNWNVIGAGNPSTERLNRMKKEIIQLDQKFDWIFAYGYRDQALLVYLTRILVPLLKPMGFMIAGLDHSLNFTKDNTFDRFIKQLGQTRQLIPSVNCSAQAPSNLVIGTATNPVHLKKRREKVIVASIQAGLPMHYHI